MQNLLKFVVQLLSVDCHLNSDFFHFESVVQPSYPINSRAPSLNLQICFLQMNLAPLRQKYPHLLADESGCLLSHLVSGGVEPLNFSDSVSNDEVLNIH